MEQAGLFKGQKIEVPKVTDLEANNIEITFDVLQSRSLKTCGDCHQGWARSPDKVLAKQNEILARVNARDASIMPQTSKGYRPLTECEKQILVTWFDDQKVGRSSPKISTLSACGGDSSGNSDTEPTLIPQPTPNPTPDKPQVDFSTLELSFANLKKEILEPKCLRCHVPVDGKDNTILESLSAIQGQELVSATAEKSVLYQVVIPGMNKRFMPPPKSGNPPLTAEEADYLKRWIESLPPNDLDF